MEQIIQAWAITCIQAASTRQISLIRFAAKLSVCLQPLKNIATSGVNPWSVYSQNRTRRKTVPQDCQSLLDSRAYLVLFRAVQAE